MVKDNYIIFLLGIVGIVSAMTWTIVGTIISLIILLLMLEQIFCGGKWTRKLYQWLMLRKVFEVYYTQANGSRKTSYTTMPSSNTQEVRVSLRILSEVHINRIEIRFCGSGSKPSIMKLSDWTRVGHELSNLNILPIADGTGYAWEYEMVPMMLSYGEEIPICISYKAANSFDGNLQVELKARETRRKMVLPFKVEDRIEESQ